VSIAIRILLRKKMKKNGLLSQIKKIRTLVGSSDQYQSDPAKTQEKVLEQLLAFYKLNEYGRQHGSESIGSYEEYKNAFPVKTYDEYRPLIDQVLEGNTHSLLSEEPVAWQTTRGTTTGTPKLIPFIPADIEKNKLVIRMGIAYVTHKKDFSLFAGKFLNLNNRSNLDTIKTGSKELPLGYGVSVKANHIKAIKALMPLVPTQEEIDNLGGGSTKEDWDARHELVYQKTKDKNITAITAIAKSAMYFGRYLNEKYDINPRDLWNIKVIALSSWPGINTRLAGKLHAYYGHDADIREFYAATEGIFGGQLDEKRAWSPYYDNLFFEVKTIDGIKQMHEMRPGEIGSLIVSTPVFPRYRIGDLILAFEPPYFRCIGRENIKLEPFCFEKL